MHVTFCGAAREVTGSLHLLTVGSNRIMLDCGLFQGKRKEAEGKNRVLPVDPGIVTNVVLSHAHMDHSGRIPFLTKENFFGRIVCTDATADACRYLLLDSARIQEADADYLNYKTVRWQLNRLKSSSQEDRITPREIKEMKKTIKRAGNELNRELIQDLLDRYRLEKVTPLYTSEEAEKSLEYFDGYPYHHAVTIGDKMTCRFYDAGHIIGSAIILIKAVENERRYNICFTGDFGRFCKPILRDPTLMFEEEDRDVDLLIMESTYGNREHEPITSLKERLLQVVQETVGRGGTVLIPAFAFGRAQELIYVLHELYEEGLLPKIPIYIDSPLAANLTKVFGEHPEVYDIDTHKTFLENGKNPFAFRQLTYIGSVDESMALMRDERPSIIIASSGMCEGGRILHHLRYRIHNEKHTILIVGFMARNTLGRRLLEAGTAYEESKRSGAPPVLRFLDKEYPLRAHVVQLGGFSAHGDRNELMRLLKESNLNIRKIAVVHGEEEQAVAFGDHLGRAGFPVTVPRLGESITV
ncbi:MAG: MBL fold metallo-hydrolase RNA specificity domain-containing protein [Thermodesulfobacteriota bacterium]